MSDLFSRNLLEPLTFPQGEIDQFIQRHICGLCNSWLVAMPAPNRRYFVHCSIHGNLIESQAITRHQAEQVTEGRYIGQREMRQPSGKSPEEILSELGF